MRKTNLLITLFLSCTAWVQAQINPKPFVVPELKEWKGGEGQMAVTSNTRVVYSAQSPEMKQVAEALAADYQEMFGTSLTVTTGKARKGDICLVLKKDKHMPQEGYRMEIDDCVEISAVAPVGAYWATRTLLQMSEQDETRSLACGDIYDFPDYPVRGFMLDCGRKFFPMSFLEDYVKMMAYYKMNTFQIHLNDNGFQEFYNKNWNDTYAAFRLECDTYPGLTAEDGFYTKKEFKAFQDMAFSHFVDIIPEIDAPAHSLAFTHYKPEIGSQKYGMDHLDLSNPETYTFMDGLFKEYLDGPDPVFKGKHVNIGTDEYSNKDPKVVEQFRAFTDHYIKYVESFGKQVWMWGALTHASGKTPVKAENVVLNLWNTGFANPEKMKELGYKMVNMYDWDLYIVPVAGYYHDYLDIKRLYENWSPAHVGKSVFPEQDPAVLGAMFAVWNDHVGNGVSVKDVHHRAFPALQTLAAKMWQVKNTVPFDEFDRKRQALSEAPGVNVGARIGQKGSLVYQTVALTPGKTLPYEEIGYDYTVEMDLDAVAEKKGTVLLESGHATVYLADPVKGLLGFSRDGYLYTFNYRIKPGQVHLAIQGDSKSTRLYVNGQLKEEMALRPIHYKDAMKMTQIRTLVFPLKQVGQFQSKIQNFQVYNYLK